MAREATARLYDVDVDSIAMKRLTFTGSYDTGTITFRAKPGRLLDLDKLHESVWATRLSGGTRSGLVSLEVTVIGEVSTASSETTLRVQGSEAHFVLAEDSTAKPEQGRSSAFAHMQKAAGAGATTLSVSGRLDGWAGKWPEVLSKLPPKPRRILVTSVREVKTSASNQK